MDWPQYVTLGLMVLGFGIELAKHGERKTGEHNAGIHLISSVITWWLLWMGGFFG